MTYRIGALRRLGFATSAVVLGWMLAACAPRLEGPALVVSGGTPPERGSATITIQRGQSLSQIAQSYHLPMRVIAEANGLSPPYRIQVGRTLVIPGAGPPRSLAATASVATLAPPLSPEVSQPTSSPN